MLDGALLWPATVTTTGLSGSDVACDMHVTELSDHERVKHVAPPIVTTPSLPKFAPLMVISVGTVPTVGGATAPTTGARYLRGGRGASDG